MALGNFQNLTLKRETTKGTTIKPNKFVKFESASLNTKINMRAVKQCEGKTFTPAELAKGTIETTGQVDFAVDRENILYFLNMMTDTPTPTDNGDGTYTHSFNIETSYNQPSYTVDLSKDGFTQRSNGVVASGLNLQVDNEIIKGTVELMGLKSITQVKVLATASASITVSAADSLLFTAGDKIVKSGEASLAIPTLAVATVVSVDTTTGVITVGTGEGTPYSVLVGATTGITLQKNVASFTSGLKTFGWYENAAITVGGVVVPMAGLNIDMKNADDGRYLSWSNGANSIRQGERTMECGFEVDGEHADALLFAYANNTPINFSAVYTGTETIGTGTANPLITVSGIIQIKEAPVDIKVSEFITVPFKADFINTIVYSVKTTVAIL